jgi:pimeloyl-ACP methyl ester carboxylesterase
MKKLLPVLLGKYINAMSYLFPSHAASLGFRIFCYPVRVAIKSYQKDFFASASQSVLAHNGEEIKVYKWNNGPRKILFLHGWQSHSFRWKSYLDSFPPDEFTIYSIDAPGHGLSSGSFLTVPLYSEIVEKFILQHGPVDIVSHSLGSFTALYTLHRLPLLPVGKLVLLAPPGEATEFLDFYKRTLNLTDKAVGLIKDHFEGVIEQQVEFFSAPNFAKGLMHSGLIIHDEDDDETPVHHAASIHKAWKRSTLVVTKGLSHNLKSKEVIARVAGFIKGIDVTEGSKAGKSVVEQTS